MKYVAFFAVFCLVFVFIGHAEDCKIVTIKGDVIDCTHCRWSGDTLFFSYQGKETSLQKDQIKYLTMIECETPETNIQNEESTTDCCTDLVDEFVGELKASGMIMDITEYGEVYVNNLWYLLPYSDKETVAKALALYNCCHNGNEVWIDIKDGYSGKKIAKVTIWGSFKVIE